jgi:hypothetical protein
MRLSFIATEGFRYENGMSLQDFQRAAKKDRVKLLRQKGRLVFYSEDSQDDFIFIEPLMQAKALPIKPRDPNALSTFEGAKIEYGFTIRDPEDYFGKHESISTSDKFESKLPELENQLEFVAANLGFPPYADLVRPKIIQKYLEGDPRRYIKFKQFGGEWLLVIDRIKRGIYKDWDGEIAEKSQQLNKFFEIFQELQDSKYQQEKEQRKIKKKQNAEQRKDQASLQQEYIGKLQFAFAKAMKNPQGTDEMLARNEFLEISVLAASEHFQNADIHIIFYPESGTRQRKKNPGWRNFNELFAEQLGGLLNPSSGVHEIKKVDPDKVKIAMDELERRAKMIGTRTPFKLNGKTIRRNSINWPIYWAEKEANKLRTQLKNSGEIKSVSMADKRRYAQLFQLTTGGAIDPERLQGSNILIVDDNVHHQGTMEMLHALINVCKPAEIRMFTPLLLRSFY